MQTFLTHGSDYASTARDLDRQRLGKQRLECQSIIKAHLTGKGWIHHPATEMWDGHTNELAQYALTMCNQWVARGYHDTMASWFLNVIDTTPETGPPWWVDDELLKLTHRSNLVRKDSVQYQQYDVPDDLVYVWPVIVDGHHTLRVSKPDVKRVRAGERSLPDGVRLTATTHYVRRT